MFVCTPEFWTASTLGIPTHSLGATWVGHNSQFQPRPRAEDAQSFSLTHSVPQGLSETHSSQTQTVPRKTHVLCLRSLSSTEPRHPRAHQAPSNFALPPSKQHSTPGAFLSVATWFLVRYGENGVWLLPHCPQTSLLEEVLGSGYMSHTQCSQFGDCMCLLLF